MYRQMSFFSSNVSFTVQIFTSELVLYVSSIINEREQALLREMHIAFLIRALWETVSDISRRIHFSSWLSVESRQVRRSILWKSQFRWENLICMSRFHPDSAANIFHWLPCLWACIDLFSTSNQGIRSLYSFSMCLA